MSLNIKNPRAHKLAKAVAKRTGKSLSAIVTEALEEKLAALEGRDAALAAELMRLGESCAARLPIAARRIDHGTLLYDDKGLPR